MKSLYAIIICIFSITQTFAQSPVRLAIAGLSHDHVTWILNRAYKKDIILVGIYETNPELVERYTKKHNLNPNLFFNDLDKMLDQIKPDAVSAFGAISDHITIVQACAPRKIHVMVEKPLATTFKDAKEIQALALKHSIHVLTNFETSWYTSNQYVQNLVNEGKLGEIRKVMVNDGHDGPKEIGVSKEFLEILTDPIKNGAGAATDFGCYGANLITGLLNGERPLSVTAVFNQNKPDIYKKVDDEASIILQYPKAQCIIQGSWNWAFSRKDMEVYGTKGYAVAVNDLTVRQRIKGDPQEETLKLNARPEPYNDPFSLFAAVVSGKLVLNKNDNYGLPINVTVVEILDAAKESAKSKKTVFLEHR